jgi:hypothetical protein
MPPIAKAAESASHRALDKRLTANFCELKTKRIKTEAGEDDCTTLLHDAHFLPRIASPVNTLWLRAQ